MPYHRSRRNCRDLRLHQSLRRHQVQWEASEGDLQSQQKGSSEYGPYHCLIHHYILLSEVSHYREDCFDCQLLHTTPLLLFDFFEYIRKGMRASYLCFQRRNACDSIFLADKNTIEFRLVIIGMAIAWYSQREHMCWHCHGCWYLGSSNSWSPLGFLLRWHDDGQCSGENSEAKRSEKQRWTNILVSYNRSKKQDTPG